MFFSPRALLCISLLFCIAACSGGGGGGTIPATQPTVPPPTSKPPTQTQTIGDVKTIFTSTSSASYLAYDGDDASLVVARGSAPYTAIGSVVVPMPAGDSTNVIGLAYDHSTRSFYVSKQSGLFRAPVGGTAVAVPGAHPIGSVAVDASGNVYFIASDGSIQSVKSGVVQTLAPSGTLVTSNDAAIPSIAFDTGDGALYATSPGQTEVKRITLGGVVTVFAGSCYNPDGYGCRDGSVPGAGGAAHLGAVSGIASDGSTIYVSDESNNAIWSISSTGQASVLAGYGQPEMRDGNGLAAFFNAPLSLAYAADTGTLYVGEWTGAASLALKGQSPPSAASPVAKFFATFQSEPMSGALAPDGSYWVAELARTHAVAHVTASGVTEYPLQSDWEPTGPIAVDADGSAWAAAQVLGAPQITSANGIVRVTASGAQTPYTIASGSDAMAITGVAIGPDGRPWFSEFGNGWGSAIGTVTSDGTVLQYTLTPGGLPAPPATPGPRARSVSTGSNGTVWFSTQDGIGSIAGDGTISPMSSWIPATTTAIFMSHSSADNSVWYVDGSNVAGRVSSSGSLATVAFASSSNAIGLTVSNDGAGDAWIAQGNPSYIVRITPTFGITTYMLPLDGQSIEAAAVRSDGKVWVTGNGGTIMLLDPAAYDAAGLPH